MGKKGGKLSQEATDACERAVETLAPLGEISSRKMFGGYGIFESGVMFALVNSKGVVHLKADDSNRERFVEYGSDRHGRMPYYAVPSQILGDERQFQQWAKVSVEIAHAAKRK